MIETDYNNKLGISFTSPEDLHKNDNLQNTFLY